MNEWLTCVTINMKWPLGTASDMGIWQCRKTLNTMMVRTTTSKQCDNKTSLSCTLLLEK